MPKTPVKIARRPNQLGGSSSSLIFGALYGTSALGSLGSEEEEMDTALEPGAIFFVSGTLLYTGYCRNGGQVGLSTSPKQFNWRPSAGVLRSSVLREAIDQAARRRNGVTVQVTCRHRTQRTSLLHLHAKEGGGGDQLCNYGCRRSLENSMSGPVKRTGLILGSKLR